MAKDVHRVATDSRVGRNLDGSKVALVAATVSTRAYRRKSFPIRTGVAAASLFVIGTFLLYVSTLIGLDEEKRGISFLVLGLIAFIPGSYATYQLYGAWKGWKGYDYDQIPSYDD